MFCEPSDSERRTETFLRLEALERRDLMSANAVPDVQALAVAGSAPYTPAEIRAAYGFNSVTFKNGTVAGTGAGETIAIIDAYGDSHIAGDLAAFDATFHLAGANLRVVNENGGANLPASSNSSWAMETSLDVEWAHAIAPGATILLVQANSSSMSDLLTAVNYARNAPGVSVVSMSWGASEFQGENSFDSYFTTPAGHTGVTFVGSSGDTGAPSLWPALSPNVLAVGGTTLSVTSSGGYISETAWSESGGGVSMYEPEPFYQHGVQSTGARTGPDVSYDANPNTGFYVYDTLGASGWYDVGGTSACAPQWSALIAIADQGRAATGQAALNGVQSQIYSLPSSDFHDITSGNNGYAAHAGYDLVTGRGSPVANLVIAGLVGATGAAPSAVVQAAQVQATVVSIRSFEAGLSHSIDEDFPSANGVDSSENSTSPAMLQAFQQFAAAQSSTLNTLIHGDAVADASVLDQTLMSSSRVSAALADLAEVTIAQGTHGVTNPQIAAAAADAAHVSRDTGKASATDSTAYDLALFGGYAGADEAHQADGQAIERLLRDLESVWSASSFDTDWDSAAVSPVAPVVAQQSVDNHASALLTVVAGLAIGLSEYAAEGRLEASSNTTSPRTWPLASGRK